MNGTYKGVVKIKMSQWVSVQPTTVLIPKQNLINKSFYPTKQKPDRVFCKHFCSD